MANFIDKSYFRADIMLPKGEYDNIETHIARFEKEVLTYLLGYELHTALVAGAAVEPYKSLLNGKVYEISQNGKTKKVKWNGLKNTDLSSLIGYYVYCEYLRNQVLSIQQVGAVFSKQENSNIASVNGKIFSAWASFEELYGYYGQNPLIPSAYNYLTKHKDLPEFECWEFTSLRGSINSHDL